MSSTLANYGVIRAPALLLKHRRSLALQLVDAVDAVADIAPRRAAQIAEQLRDPSLATKTQGLHGLAQLFVDESAVRDKILRAIERVPKLSEQLTVWNDGAWMRAVDTILGIGESLQDTDPQFFVDMRARLPAWSTNLYSIPQTVDEIRTFLVERLEKNLKCVLTPPVIRSNSSWKRFLPRLWMYWALTQFSFSVSSTLPSRIRSSAMVLRAMRRFAASPGVESTDAEYYRAIVHGLFYRSRGAAYSYVPTTHYRNTWELVHRITPPQDPLDPLPVHEYRNNLSSELHGWIAAVIGPRTLFDIDARFMKALTSGRKLAVQQGAEEELCAILTNPEFKYPELLEALERFEKACESKDRELYSEAHKSRLVVWNPYKVPNDIVLNVDMGEGRVIDGPDERGMVTLQLVNRMSPVRVFNKRNVPASDREAFLDVLKDRADAYSSRAVIFAAFVLRYNLPKSDPARQRLVELDWPRGNEVKLVLNKFYEESVDADNLHDNLIGIGHVLGFDPISWAWRFVAGRYPSEIIAPGFRAKVKASIDRRVTPDLVRALIWFQPWLSKRRKDMAGASPVVQAAGNYYPTYYRGPREEDYTDLYFALRNGVPEALDDAATLMHRLVERWSQASERSGDVLVVPMIGTAPLTDVAGAFGQPVLFPWLPRPDDYHDGVEGRTLSQKMEMLEKALRVDPIHAAHIEGKSVLVVDDNVTDHATWVTARGRLFELGAAEVNLVALTRTIRRPEDH